MALRFTHQRMRTGGRDVRMVVLLIAVLGLLSAVSASATSLPTDAGALQSFRPRAVIISGVTTPSPTATPTPTQPPARLATATPTPRR